MPIALVLLAVIALVLYILFGYLLPPIPNPPLTPTGRCVLAWIVVILVLIFWFVLPIRIG